MEKIKNFFVNLYDKFMGLSWVQWTIAYCKAKPVMAIAIGLTFILVVAVLISLLTHKKPKKNEQADGEFTVEEITSGEEVAVAEETSVEEIAPVEDAVVEETPVEEVAVAEDVAPVVEEKPAPKKKAPVKKAETPVVKAEESAPAPKKEEKPAPKAETKPVAPKAEEKPAPKKKAQPTKATKPVEKAPEPAKSIETDETDTHARYAGKWTICRVMTDEENSEEMYFFELHASNGEKLLSSEEYTTYQGALRGIETHKANILKGNLKITVSKKGDYIFKLLSGKNMLLCMGENYPTKVRCEKAMESTIRFAKTAVIDESVQDVIIKVPKEDGAPLPTLPENCVGKWIISSMDNVDGEKIFYFELYANNGQKLLSSEEYTTYIGAVNGIQTHKANILKGNFRISLTKRGDYIYKLLNGNGQLLCLGEHYKTKALCQNAVESVKRFAANASVFANAEEK